MKPEEGIWCRDSLEVDEKQVTSTILLDSECGNLRKVFGDELLIESNAEPSDWLRPDASEGVIIIDNYFSASPPRLEEVIDDFNGVGTMVAMFSKYTSPVRGLCFSPHSANYLASGGPEGKVLLWDLAEAYTDIIPTTEHVVSKGDISFLAWSPSMENALLATSHIGETAVMDLRAKSAIMSKSHADAELSCCQWFPSDSNLILTANRSNTTPFTVWDIRKMNEPVKRFGKEISGANCVSFCPVDIDLFLASTDDDIFTLSIKDDWIKNQRRCGKSCGDVHFKGKSGEMFAAATGDGIDMYRWEIIDDRDEDCPDFIEYC